MEKQNIKLVLEYDGTDFSGWQIQPNHKTIQGELEKALSTLFQESISVTAAGRTDAGVHARAQVVNFHTSKNRPLHSIRNGLNAILADTISIKSAQIVKREFSARFDAIRRTYRYEVVRTKSALRIRYAWCVTDNLNLAEMQRCARLIRGDHDFKSFCSSQAEVKHYRCTVEKANWLFNDGESLQFSITANRFLHNMVRVLVGTMIEAGKGRYSPDELAGMLTSKNRKAAGITAPARGLYLDMVEYK